MHLSLKWNYCNSDERCSGYELGRPLAIYRFVLTASIPYNRSQHSSTSCSLTDVTFQQCILTYQMRMSPGKFLLRTFDGNSCRAVEGMNEKKKEEYQGVIYLRVVTDSTIELRILRIFIGGSGHGQDPKNF